MNRGNIYQLSVKLLQEKRQGPFFFLASEQEIFLAWGKGKATPNSPRLLKKFFSATSPRTELWKDFSSEEEYYPKYYLHLSQDNQLFSNIPQDELTPFPLEESDFPALEPDNEDPQAWMEYCRKIEDSLTKKELQKVVPAHTRSYKAKSPFNRHQKAALFRKLLQSFPLNAHIFCFQENEDVFLGASPELLFKIEDETLLVPALAGTSPRSPQPELDQALGQELLSSPKERNEHRFVVDFISSSLKELGLNPQYESIPELLRLSTLQHLYTPIRAKLSRNSLNPKKILQALHPTPAMAGTPQSKAQAFITAQEGFERGLYASPLGYILPNGNARFVVGIRSMLLSQDKIHLFAGAGFVEGSHPQTEWQEIAQKMKTMEQLFGK